MENNTFEITYNPDEPLTNKMFENKMSYADQKQDSRTDEVLKTLDSILFWVRIIGIYFIIKILITLFTIFATGQAINEISKMMNVF